MLLENPGHSVRVVLSAALFAGISACADSPSAPRDVHPNSIAEAARTAATEGAVTSRAISRATRHIVRQVDGSLLKIETLVARDGRSYVVESALDVNGLPRELRVSRDGQLIARINNDWKEHARGFALERQRFVRIAEDGTTRAFDSESQGGIARMIGTDIVVARGAALAAVNAATARQRAGFRSYMGDDDFGAWETGPCDDKARATDAALDGWISSVVILGAAFTSANPVAAFSAAVYEVKAWRDFTRAEDALDQCVADAGKKREEEF
jgi:hypothetical protein